MTGGETADVGDLVRTIIVDSTVVARIKKEEVYKRQRTGQMVDGVVTTDTIYPDWGTQLDYIYHHGIDKWKTDIVDPVKAKYPKPS